MGWVAKGWKARSSLKYRFSGSTQTYLNQNLQGGKLGVPVFNKLPTWFLATNSLGNIKIQPGSLSKYMSLEPWRQSVHPEAARDKKVLSHTEATSVRKPTPQAEAKGAFTIMEWRKELWIKPSALTRRLHHMNKYDHITSAHFLSKSFRMIVL